VATATIAGFSLQPMRPDLFQLFRVHLRVKKKDDVAENRIFDV
jgi:hypothetical protein